jgi:hypothetical protein
MITTRHKQPAASYAMLAVCSSFTMTTETNPC